MSFKTPDLLDDNESKDSGDGASASSHRCSDVTAVARVQRPDRHAEAVRGQLAGARSLAEDGKGKVLVIDGGGSLRCALVGDQLAILAHKNGWEGIVVYGCIRDSDDISQDIDLGLRALNTHPLKSIKKGVGDRDLAVTFGGVTFKARRGLNVIAETCAPRRR
jgi:regulator of ribonuclease activity A